MNLINSRKYICKTCNGTYRFAWEAICCCRFVPITLGLSNKSSLSVGNIVIFNETRNTSYSGNPKWVYKDKKTNQYFYYYLIYAVIEECQGLLKKYNAITLAVNNGTERMGVIYQENLHEVGQLLNPTDSLLKETKKILNAMVQM